MWGDLQRFWSECSFIDKIYLEKYIADGGSLKASLWNDWLLKPAAT